MLEVKELDKNFRFLTLEVTNLVLRSKQLLDRPDIKAIQRIRARDDYIDNLRSMIENATYQYLQEHRIPEKSVVNYLRSINKVALNLERIADYGVNIARQLEHLTNTSVLHRYPYDAYYEVILSSLADLGDAMHKLDAARAREICHAEIEIDALYEQTIKDILDEMHFGKEIPNLVTTLFIFRYLERIGDSLLNIGEAIISSKMGEPLTFREFRILNESVANFNKTFDDALSFEGIWGTRSGSLIGKVSERLPEHGSRDLKVIFKKGAKKKIVQERDNIKRWTELFPGVTPGVLEYHEDADEAAILIEFVDGRTFDEIVIAAPAHLLLNATKAVQSLVSDIWTKTMDRSAPFHQRFVGQLLARLNDVFIVHPYFEDSNKSICGLSVPSLADRLNALRELDDVLPAPFCVFGHGDFNVDNIIYEEEQSSVHLIDVYRSGKLDYVQDLSVFLVSNFRMPVFEPELRQRMNQLILSFLDFGRKFAERNQDHSFDTRMALGLIRSFITSTRFELNQEFADRMLRRALFLLERLNNHKGKPWEEFNLPEEVVTYS